MTKTIKTSIGVLFALTVLSQTVSAQNHSLLTSQHNQTSERFAAQNLKTNGSFDLAKINQFIERLQIEKKSLANDMYETKIIEKLELEIESHKDAIKSAKKELDTNKSKYIIAYDQYLIPKMTALRDCVGQNRPQFMCEGIMDQFIDGYAGFYLPEAPRNIFHQDLDVLFIGKNFFGYSFKRHENKVEAANLKVESENLARTKACLPEVRANDLLDQVQIAKLKACNVDISIYNPAEESLVRKQTPETLAEAKDRHNDWFPTENDIIYFKKVKFSSAGSPKMEGEFERNGEDVDVKIKMGHETHVEITSSILAKMIGMFQDTSVMRKTLRVHFKGDTDYDAFKAQWKRKYSGLNKELSSFVVDYGRDGHGNYVTLQDVQLSINDPKFLRIAPYDPAGWDLPNRREHRAQILWFGLVNMIDSKTGNHMLLFEQTPTGLKPRYSMQDVGYSLQFQINPLRPFEMLRSAQSWGVNTFDHTFLDWSADKIHINWADILFNRDRFNTTTYSDLKWMARKIARLSYDDIKYAVKSADFPPEIEDLYIHKITNRRNEIVRAFELTGEFTLYPVVDFKTYSPSKKVKNGDVVVSHFDGYVSYELPRNTLLPFILQGAASLVKLEALDKQLKAKVSSDISLAYQSESLGKVLNVKDISGGIGLELNRSVEINNQYVMRGDQSQGFVVKDRFAVEINVGSSIFTTLKGLFPDQLAVNGNIKVWRREFEFIHFANTWLEGYRSPVKLFKFIPHWKSCIVDCIGRGEVLKISDSYGISAGAKVPVGAVAGVPLTLGASVFWQNSKPTYFSRDHFNQLIIYEAENTMFGYSATAGLDAGLDLILFNLPFLEFSKTSYFYDHKSALYRFSAPKSVENFSVLEQMRAKEERELLSRYLESGDSDPLVLAKKDLDIKAKGEVKKSAFSFLFLFKKEKATGYSKATVKTSNKEVRNFQRYSREESSLFGADKAVLLIDKMATVVSKDTTNISIEMDEAEPDKMVAYLEVWNYERKLNRKGLVDYITDLNKFYSKDANTPFYSDYYLPAKEQMDKYRKIYGHTRIYFYGDTLLNNLKLLTEKQLEGLFANNYKGDTSCHYGAQKQSGTNCPYSYDLNKFLDALHDIKKLTVKDQKFLKQYYKVLASMGIRENGIGLAKAVATEDKMFVMGEIYGVYPSFSTMNQDEQYAGRRFAGKSWGNYKIPPLRKFLNNHSITQESIYINGEINFDDIFGPMPTGNVDYY
ncbi:hypothetical protein [Pseudobdellovibrio sp. HCB154]|uniref:hypothetical protein n=1 Tax=Pseudobdellovibrio sp. HCB154 TaxID=3386277 RepID=UPI00391722D4